MSESYPPPIFMNTTRSFKNSEMDSGAAMDKVDKADICKGVELWRDAEVVYPSSGGEKMLIAIKPNDPKMGQPTPIYESFLSGDHSLAIQFCIAYKTLGKTHYSAFCYFYRRAAQHVLAQQR
jgi:hypothetical protein